MSGFNLAKNVLIPFIACVLLGTGAMAQEKPNPELQKLVRDLTVQVRETDTESGQEGDRGCGFVVGSDGATLTIVTARHVIDRAITNPKECRVSVLFSGMTRWIDATVGTSLDEKGVLDAARIAVPLKASPFDGKPPCEQLSLAPPAGKDERIWVFGFDPGADATTWAKAISRGTIDDVLSFNGRGVMPGFSGGVVVSELGLVGVTIRAGPDGQRHDALLAAGLLDRVRATGGDVQIRTSPVREALRNMATHELLGALEVWDFEEARWAKTKWGALLPIRSSEPGLVTHLIMQDYRVECLLVAESERVRLTYRANPLLNFQVPPESIEFIVDTRYTISGFVILSATSGTKTYFLALPSEKSELLAARVLASAANPNGPAVLSDRAMNCLNLEFDRRVNSALTPFSICIYSQMEADLTVPLSLYQDKPIRLVATRRLPTVLLTSQDAASLGRTRAVWESLRLQILKLGPVQSELCSSRIVLQDGDFELGNGFLPTGEMFRLTHTGVTQPNFDYQGTELTAILLQGLRIQYGR